MQRLDLYVNGRLINTNQKSNNPAFLARVNLAVQNAEEVVVRRHGASPPPPKPGPTGNLLVGKGLFTAWQANAANGKGADWIAVQADPEGNQGGFRPGNSRVIAWEARASRGMEAVTALGAVGYIGQAENPDEFAACMRLGNITVPKYLCGKPDGWGNSLDEVIAGMKEAKAKGWGLLIEWYWGDQNELVHGPDSMGYPVDAVLFGCYSPRNPDERKYLDEYLQVYHGAYGCYTAETMIERDWLAWAAS